MKKYCLIAILVICSSCASTPPSDIQKQSAEAEQTKKALGIVRGKFESVIQFAKAHPELFQTEPSKPRLLMKEQKEQVLSAWQTWLDGLMMADQISAIYKDRQSINKDQGAAAFEIYRGAFMLTYRRSLDWLALTANNATLDILYNDDSPEWGLTKGSYDKFKLRFLNAARASEFLAFQTLDGYYTQTPSDFRSTVNNDASAIIQYGLGKGALMTSQNAFDVAKKLTSTAWMPVQASVAEFMGDVKVNRFNSNLISGTQIDNLRSKVRPGDFFLERREWYLSNLGLPGFWTHAALYVGTPAERQVFFNDAEVRAWVQSQGEASGDFEALLKIKFPKPYADSLQQVHGEALRLLEAISEGVTFTSLEHSAAADSLAVLRPRLSKKEIAEALLRAYSYAGRPYDFDFDFVTDSTLVCSELVFKAYQPAQGYTGIRFDIQTILGRPMTPPNLMVEQFDRARNGPSPQYDLVEFLDGNEWRGAAEASVDEFRTSWKRPKWYALKDKP
jgi:hypothetical protein